MLAAEIGTSQQLRFCSLRERIPWTWLAVTLGVAIAAICYFAHNVPQRACDLAVALFAAALMVAPLSAKGVLLRRALSVKPLVFLGAFAYSTYLLHLPLLRLLAHSGLISFTKDANGTFLRLVSTLPVVVLGCYVFYLVFERPFITSPAAAKPVLPVGDG
jgi:peptidoglycan/LPS O-acetylase OafA/YrhL